jgi:hypothetical protein
LLRFWLPGIIEPLHYRLLQNVGWNKKAEGI